MKRTRIFLLLFGFSAILFTSCDPCTKRVDCPAYDGTFLFSWFPYNEGDTKYFSDMSGNRDTLIISKIVQTAPHRIEYRTGTNGKMAFCDVKGTITSKTDKTHPGWIGMNLEDVQQGEYSYIGFTFNFHNLNAVLTIENNDLAGLAVDASKFSTETHQEVLLNGNAYNNVFVISTKDTATAAKDKIDKVYIIKGKGVFGYRTYPDSVEYWLQ